MIGRAAPAFRVESSETVSQNKAFLSYVASLGHLITVTRNAMERRQTDGRAAVEKILGIPSSYEKEK